MHFLILGDGSLTPNSPGERLRNECGLVSAAVFFPQYHQDINNDIFWGDGFTEWDNIRGIDFDEVAKHELRTPVQEYTLNLHTMKEQASLAKAAGIGAFIFYSYWFEYGRRALELPLLQLLPRERLGINFALSWANEPWTRRWNGEDGGEMLMPQSYGSSFDWSTHFDWLKQYFSHPDYLHIDGRPVLFIYNMRHIAESKNIPPEVGQCDSLSESKYGPGGISAAKIYKRWYSDLEFMDLTEVHGHWIELGRQEGRQWPSLSCTESEVRKQMRERAERKSAQGSVLVQMISFLHEYAKVQGFKGIFVVGTLNSFVYASQFDSLAGGVFDAAAQFLPMTLEVPLAEEARSCGCSSVSSPFHKSQDQECPPTCACIHNATRRLARSRLHRPASSATLNTKFFHGAFNSWSNYPRNKATAMAICSEPDFESFSELIKSQLLSSLEVDCTAIQKGDRREASSVLFINAWNEWGEQAVLEPTIQDGNAALLAHLKAVTEIENDFERYSSLGRSTQYQIGAQH